MENKINIAELLKDCPKGMELDCTVYDDVTFNKLQGNEYIIINRGYNGGEVHLNKFGQIFNSNDSKCVIFPKGKNTWEEFQKPFKDGDIIYVITENNNEYITIFKNNGNVYLETYIDFAIISSKCSLESSFYTDNIKEQRLATEEEKQKLFDAIKANGYKWNAETKILEKLLKFKIGDRITDGKTFITIRYIDDEYYYEIGKTIGFRLSIKNQDKWELVTNKFDISTLKPFESRVLVRDNDNDIWYPAIFGKYSDENMTYRIIIVGGLLYKQCIPYENNEHLLNTTNDCNDYYKTW